MTFSIYWISESGQNSIHLGDFASMAEAEAGIPDAWEAMREMGSNDDQAWIDAGSIEIYDQGAE